MTSASPSSKATRRRPKASAHRTLLWLGASVATGGVILLFGAQAWLESYLKGDVFRRKTEAAIGRVLHAECALTPLQRQGSALTTDSLRLAGQTGAFFKTAQIQGLNAELDLEAIWRRVWKIETLRFQRLELNLEPPPIATSGRDPEAAPDPSATHWWTALLPRKTELGHIHTDRATLTRAGASLKDARLDVRPSQGGWEILLEAGDLKWPGLPAMELSQSKFVAHPDADFTGKARVLVKTGGQMALAGGWVRESGVDIHAQLENVEAKPFLPLWWQSRLRGSMQGNLRFVQAVNAKDGELSGDIKLTGATFEALPLFAQLDKFIQNTRFSQVPLKTASFHFSQTPERTEFRDIDLDAGGPLRITGSVTVKSGSLRGALKLGISSSLTQWLPETRTKIFSEAREGYLWAPFEVSGTPEDPKENLSALLVAAAIETATDVVKDLPGKIPQALPAATKGVLDAVKSLLPQR